MFESGWTKSIYFIDYSTLKSGHDQKNLCVQGNIKTRRCTFDNHNPNQEKFDFNPIFVDASL